MKKDIVFAVGVLALLCMTGCGRTTSDTTVSDQPKTEIADHFQKEKTATDQLEETEQPAEEETGPDENETSELPTLSNEEALASLRKMVTENGDLCAAVWLGDGMDIASFLKERQEEAYQFLQDIPKDRYVEQNDGGMEIYAIIPADPLSTVTIYEWISDESNGFYGETGDILYESAAGDPFFLRANPSDVQPSTQIVITDSSGEILEWSPCLSLYDGTMVTPWYSLGVTDLTDYSSEPFFGWWCIWVPDDNDFSMNLNFQRFGNHMSYSYGYGNSELLAAYTGTWEILEEETDGTRVRFSMTNVDDPDDIFQGIYRLNRVDENYLEVIYEEGSRIGESPMHLFEWSSY